MLISKLIIIAVLAGVVTAAVCCRKKIQRLVDNAISKSVFSQLLLLVAVTGTVFGLLMLVMWLKHQKLELGIFDSIFAFINPGSSFPEKTANAEKLWAIIVGVFGMILLGGLLISVFNNILERRVEKIKHGKAFYNFKEHAVIIGYDGMVVDLVTQLAGTYSEIVLQTLQEVPKVRHELFSKLPSEIEKKITIIGGNRYAAEDLERLHMAKARVLFILGERDEPDRDSVNIESLKKINAILAEANTGTDKPCHVLFENQSSYAILQQQDLSVPYLTFHPFSMSELWAQKLFVDCKYEYREGGKNGRNKRNESIEYVPLDREGINYDSDNTVHLVVIGMSKMGIALGIQASHLCHFPNFIRDGRLKTRITFIDEYADREMYFLQGRYRHLFNEMDYVYENVKSPEENHDNKTRPKFTDIEWRFIKGRVEHPAIREKLIEYAGEENTLLTIAVCSGSSAETIACGLYLPDEVYENGIQILVRQNTPHSVLSMLKQTSKYRNVKPFGMTDLCMDVSKNNDILPIIVDYVYGFYSENVEAPKSIPPASELAERWKQLEVSKKWSNRYNANMLFVKQRSFGITSNEGLSERVIEQLAEVEHNRWNIEELLLGYRPTTAEEKQWIGSSKSQKKEMASIFIHNDLCPYHEISDLNIEDGNKIKNTREYDICLSRTIPMLLGYVEKLDKNDEKEI